MSKVHAPRPASRVMGLSHSSTAPHPILAPSGGSVVCYSTEATPLQAVCVYGLAFGCADLDDSSLRKKSKPVVHHGAQMPQLRDEKTAKIPTHA